MGHYSVIMKLSSKIRYILIWNREPLFINKEDQRSRKYIIHKFGWKRSLYFLSYQVSRLKKKRRCTIRRIRVTHMAEKEILNSKEE